MLTETQLLATRPIVLKIAKGFQYLGALDDLVQEAMLTMWRSRDKFDGEDAEHWAARVARHRFVSMARRRGLELDALAQFTSAGGYYPRGVATPEDTCYARECARVHNDSQKRYAHWAGRPQAEQRARERTARAVA
jgi:RNA polymerase sigma factor (sigma-70 family)